MAANNKRVLVIDDDPDIHLAVKSILQPHYDVTCCSNGPAGLAAMRRQLPDLVLLDVMMTTMTEGINVLHEIRQDAALKATPVVVVSSIGRKTGMVSSRDAGTDYFPADGFLDKPFESARLRSVVADAIAGVPAAARPH